MSQSCCNVVKFQVLFPMHSSFSWFCCRLVWCTSRQQSY